jgi:hypothetical protein
MRIKIKDLSLEHLNSYPVWTWYEGTLGEAEDKICPVDLTKWVKDDSEVLFIKAYFIAISGMKFEGTVAYDVGRDGIYAVSLFCQGEEFVFNPSSREIALAELQRLRKSLGDPFANIFPVRFACEVEIVPGEMISGEFPL